MDDVCNCGHMWEEHFTPDGGQSVKCSGCDSCKDWNDI